MNSAIFVGSGNESKQLLAVLLQLELFTSIAVISKEAPIQALAKKHRLPCYPDEQEGIQPADVAISDDPRWDSFCVKRWTFQMAWEKVLEAIKDDLLMKKAIHAIQDGMIVVNRFAQVQFMNEAAAHMAGVELAKAIGKPIQTLLPSSGLPRVIETQQPEYNQLHEFDNGTVIVTTRVPLIFGGDCSGAIAVFKDVTEATQLAEQVTDLRSIQTMLEAIINSSNDAISVVDENGTGLMVNPAYTKLTGLNSDQIIGQPATADISEGESIHMQVLRTKKPVRGARLKLGPHKKDVIVNVAPVIVDGELKGSIGVIHDVSELNRLSSQLQHAQKRLATLEATYSFSEIVGTSKEMAFAIEQAKRGAKTSFPILLLGETGTGKELFAHAIHNESERKGQPFVRVNCAALTETLLESELFGYEQGAFSGALKSGKKGLFEEAEHGSIFLDEIGEMSPNTQAKLLRVLQEQEIVRVGGTKPIPIHVRVIAATNVDLEGAIREKRFREDLYYRLNKLPIRIPPLRERLSDLPALIDHLLRKLNLDYGHNIQSISKLVLSRFEGYYWPGNVRELENVLARSMIYMDLGATELTDVSLPQEFGQSGKREVSHAAVPKQLQAFLAEKEKEHLRQTLAEVDGVKTEAAKLLGISIRSLYYKLEKYNLA
ncbi:sigma-54 interaction domain-containing protein [Shouchella clausii]|uniref:Sigma-54-dependent Fis family transcriptional regulator n=3 Tax=Shouchella clausii TaxID=79880 RepID=A0A268RZ11_SHOCL|nr:sigma-54-dependent Fis family transcriptional regulator [Shouchella clausii]MBU8594816.1 sigma-54-dependent Fis family transcriptional regulator [Shouchella clausii]MCY1106209.1 sigma-54-dependent Fis family transcriptional regulator [Shouchella clausii]MEB5482206.1 sigma-54-dependent Fis family transcriptional regulator [Shouchella clausii]MED4160763.1 sigma-54-dependent Fis family transcriptional regulator [Shouchella clausii]MED4176644.1 sigma-54-dependent Fis family transcriptional regu